jgi:hypothetical protein
MYRFKTFSLRYAVYALSLAGFLISLTVSAWIGGAYVITLAFGLLWLAVGERHPQPEHRCQKRPLLSRHR